MKLFIQKYIWVDVFNTTCYMLNQVLIMPIVKKSPYELNNGEKSNISHLKVFGCKCFVLNNGKENLHKFHAEADEGFLGYSLNSHAYRVYIKRLMTVQEYVHALFDEYNNETQVPYKNDVEENEPLNILSMFKMNHSKKSH